MANLLLCGLFRRTDQSTVDCKPVPLTDVQLKAHVLHSGTRVQIEQRFVNQENIPIEAVYRFPLDDSAALCGFEAQLDDGTLIKASLKENKAAQEEYDDAIASGQGAFLVKQQQQAADIFEVNIGNLASQTGVRIRLQYVTKLHSPADLDLSEHLRTLQFVLPTTILPRYIPQQSQLVVSHQQARLTNKSHYDISSIEIDVQLNSDLDTITSPSHPDLIAVQIQTPQKARVTLKNASTHLRMDADFVLLIKTRKDTLVSAMLEIDEKHHSLCLMTPIVPQVDGADIDEPNTEIVFVVDCSGSMQGTSIRQAEKTMNLFLQSLPLSSRFNIVRFGSRFEKLFQSSQPFNDNTLSKAREYIRDLKANLGGTEILAPLHAIFAQSPAQGYCRQIFLLSDGGVANTEQVITTVRQNAHTTRCFSFGLGDACSRYLINGIARAGNGTAEFVDSVSGGDDTSLQRKVLGCLGRALKPALTMAQLEYALVDSQGNITALQEPKLQRSTSLLPPLFLDTRSCCFAFIDHSVLSDLNDKGSVIQVTFTAKTPAPASNQVKLSSRIGIADGHVVHGDTIHKLAARDRIRELEDSVQNKFDGAKDEIIRLSTQYGISSSLTSFVATETRSTPTSGQMERRDVPVLIHRGSDFSEISRFRGGLQSLSHRAAPLVRSRATPSATTAFSFAATGMFAPKQPVAALPARFSRSLAEHEDRLAPPPSSDRSGSASSPLERILFLQGADGSWKLTPELASALNISHAAFIGALPAPGLADVWATAVSLAVLELRFSQDRALFDLIFKRGIKFLKTHNQSALFDSAKAFVSANPK